MVNRKNNFMSKNRVILEFFYKICELSELLYLVILVLRRDVGRAVRYDVYLFCLAMLAPAYSGGGGANHLHLLRLKIKGNYCTINFHISIILK